MLVVNTLTSVRTLTVTNNAKRHRNQEPRKRRQQSDMRREWLINSHWGAWEGDLDELEFELVLKTLAGLPEAVTWKEAQWERTPRR